MSAAPTPGPSEPLSKAGDYDDLTMRLYAVNIDDEVLQS